MNAIHCATARFHGTCPPDLLQSSRAYLDQFGLDIRDEDDGFALIVPEGQSRLRREADGFTLTVTAHDRAARHQLCEGAIHMLEHVFPGALNTLGWSGIEEAGQLPPNMHPATLANVTRLSENFLRVTLNCATAQAMTKGGMHFGLLIPPEERAPVWPYLNDKGRTVWPKGDDAVHRAAFTVVAIDAVKGQVVFDLFEHAGGPSTRWAQAGEIGARVVLSGPGGGDFPPGTHMVLAGDETAIPAIRRILQTSAAGRHGVVLIETGSRDDMLIAPADLPPGFSLRWIDRRSGARLVDALDTLELPEDRHDLFVWLGAEQACVRHARTLFHTTHALPKKQTYLAAYWTASA
ncbi:siderophore-interacting protein [Rhodobacteraceae bacterium]|nr:siderophore-interacting protein [Paracoccaceae bacterium]